ncbi:MAG: transglycosylase domain-containing protein [Parcubacteria group bacterium]|nr:transglycosylase domain-containing protein [Parcubacteria group bacterium]
MNRSSKPHFWHRRITSPQVPLRYQEGRTRLAIRLGKILLKAGLVLLFLFLLATVIAFAVVARDLPKVTGLTEAPESTRIYDRTGTHLLFEFHGNERRTRVPLYEIPEVMREATIALEDKNFYSHRGVSFRGILRALFRDVTMGELSQGGSTITQQLVKNALLSSEKTFTRKLKEVVLAIELERRYSKDEILELYLNEIPYGSNAYGVEAAAQFFFRKPAKELSLSEAATLASLAKAPTYYSPYGSNPEALEARRIFALSSMVSLGFITEEEGGMAKENPPVFSERREPIEAPHFVFYVKEGLVATYGEKLVEQGGLKVITTLDYDKQKIAERAIEEGVIKNRGNHDAQNAALVALDPRTGQILAMVGSADYFSPPIPEGCTSGATCRFDPQVNVTLRVRNPGSSFKPFVYATLFGKGYPTTTVLFDLETNFGPDGSGKEYIPRNYTGTFRGPIAARDALAQSLNIPAVKALYLAGIPETIATAEAVGYTSFGNAEKYGLALALGGGGVTLLEHSAAFSVLAAEGIRHTPAAILRVEDAKGKILEEYGDESSPALPKELARTMSSILSDNNARAPVFGARNYLTLGARPVAAKTGTTNEFRDAWTMGYTPSLTTGVWVGNNDNHEMRGSADGSVVAAPIWNRFMSEALKDTPIERFPSPPVLPPVTKPMLNGKFIANETKLKIDRATGKLAGDLTPQELIDERSFGTVHSILYYVDRRDPLGPPPRAPEADPQFNRWEAAVLAWASQNGFNQAPPTEADDASVTDDLPTIHVESPRRQERITTDTLTLVSTVDSPLEIREVEISIDGALMASGQTAPFPSSVSLVGIPNGTHTLTIVARDLSGRAGKVTVPFITERAIPPFNVRLVSPEDGDAFTQKDFVNIIMLEAEARGGENGTAKVEFFASQEDRTLPLGIAVVPDEATGYYRIVWTVSPGEGRYELSAVQTDTRGYRVESDPIDVKIK